MDIARKIGILVVLIIPSFIGAGALWDLFHSWAVTFIWVAVMAVVAWNIVSGKLQLGKASSS
jgi:hypothetical protein